MAFDATFFALVALIIFLGIVAYAGGFAKMGKALDDRSAKIAGDLAEARKLLEEAQALFNESTRRRADAEKESREILTRAEQEARTMAEESRNKLSEMLDRRAKQAEQKIAQAEEQAVKDVRAAATDLAVNAARRLLQSELKGAQASSLIEDSITAIKNQLH
jgi:F-type H+-transporting ATPase subunit b